jgi:hypothetical protein
MVGITRGELVARWFGLVAALFGIGAGLAVRQKNPRVGNLMVVVFGLLAVAWIALLVLDP